MVPAFLARLFKVLKKYGVLIIVATLIISMCFAAADFLLNYNKLIMSMSLNYPGAEKGRNPDGTSFKIFEIKSVEVLDRALEKFNTTGMTVDELRSRIDIYEKSSNTIAEKIKNAKMSGDNFKYIPNEYLVSYSQKNKLDKNHTYEMLSAIAQAYREYFEERHADNNALLKSGAENIEQYAGYEYVETADLLLEYVLSIEEYISKRNIESSSFVSQETGETFANILSMIQNYRKIDVEKFKSFVISSAIAKDRTAYINKLHYNADNLSFERSKALNEAEFVKGAIQKYDPNITGVAFIPSLDANNEFYMNRTKIGIDYLATKAYNAGIAAEKLTKEIENNNYLINVFSATVHDEAEESRLKGIADNMLKDLEKRLVEIQTIAIKTDDEYISYKTRDYIKFSIPKRPIISNLRIVPTAMFAMFIFVAACLLIIIKEQAFGGRRVR